MSAIPRLEERHTKAELRELAYDLGETIPRNADKRAVARIVALARAEFRPSARELRGLEPGHFVRYDDEWHRVTASAGSGSLSARGLRSGELREFNFVTRGGIDVFEDGDMIASEVSLTAASP